MTAGRLSLLQQCLASVVHTMPQDSQIVLVVNGSHPNTVNWLNRCSYPLEVYQVPKESLAKSRNRAFGLCTGDVIHFFDDDVIVPEGLFQITLLQFKNNNEIAVLGGPNLTPPHSPYSERLFGAIVSSPFAAPLVCVRYGGEKDPRIRTATEHDLIFCNLAIRPRLIPEKLRFREHLKSNEENVFLYHCRQHKLAILFVPEAFVYHRRRKTLWKFIQQIHSYGFGRAQQWRLAFRSCHPFFLAPALLYLLPLYLSVNQALLLLLLYSFGALIGAITSRPIRRMGILSILLCIPLSAIVHLSYGFGFWKGLFHPLREAFLAMWSHQKLNPCKDLKAPRSITRLD